MMNFSVPAAAAIIILGILLYIFIPTGRARAFVMLGYLTFSAALVVGTGEILGLAKPVHLEWRDLRHKPILSMYFIENEAVYVWILDGKTPRQYSLPWDKEGAETMEDEFRKGEAMGDGDSHLSFSTHAEGETHAHVFMDQGSTLPDKPEQPAPNVLQLPEIHSPTWQPQR